MKQLILGHRQSGKSDIALYEFMKNYDNNYLIVHNLNMKKHAESAIIKRYKVSDVAMDKIHGRILTLRDDTLRAVSGVNTIIFDEYFLMEQGLREEILSRATLIAANVMVFAMKPPKGFEERKIAKSEIKVLKAVGFETPLKLKSLDPENHARMKKELKVARLHRKAEELGYILTPKSEKAELKQGIQLWGNKTVSSTASPRYHGTNPISTVTRVNPNTPSTLTGCVMPATEKGPIEPETKAVPEKRYRTPTTIRAIQGKLKFPEESTQQSLFD